MDSRDGQSLIGGDAERVDAFEKVTGKAKFVEDIQLPGLLYGRVLRSSFHHARLISIDTSDAEELPGVVAIIKADDIPGENGFSEYSRGEPLLTPVGDALRMKGAPIALIVCSTSEAADAALKAIKVAYKPLLFCFEINEIETIHGERSEILKEDRVKNGDISEAFDESDHVIETLYTTSYQEHAALERESVLGYLDEAGRITVVGGTHEPHWQRNWIAKTLALPPSKVRFITPPTGGSFGGKQDPWPLVATGLMTFLTKRPVKLIYSRSESFEASPKRHPFRCHYKIGAKATGQLTGIQVLMRVNTGAYDSAGYYIPEYAIMAGGGPYLWSAADISAQCIFTNGPKSGQFRGFGTPQPTFALECTLDEMIQILGEDPISFRQKNKIQQSSKTFLGYPVAESLGYQEVLEALKSYYTTISEEVRTFNQNNKTSRNPIRAGVGIAGMWYRFGKSGKLRIEAHAEITTGGRFVIYCSAPDYGQGIGTVMLQLAAETLSIPRDHISLINADTAHTPDSDVQGASRATYWVGNAVCEAARTLKAEILGTAAEILDCNPNQLEFKNNQISHIHDPNATISFQDIAREFKLLGKSRKVSGIFDPSPYFPEETRPMYTPHFVTGAHLAEVRVDMETGEVKVTRYVAVHDVGRVINPAGATGQIEGAVIMGLGTALKESYIPGSTSGFNSYILPSIDDIPKIEVILVEVPGYLGPMGAKGLGETAMLPSTPAIINAVSRAIGVRIRDVPATPECILQAIRIHRTNETLGQIS